MHSWPRRGRTTSSRTSTELLGATGEATPLHLTPAHSLSPTDSVGLQDVRHVASRPSSGAVLATAVPLEQELPRLLAVVHRCGTGVPRLAPSATHCGASGLPAADGVDERAVGPDDCVRPGTPGTPESLRHWCTHVAGDSGRVGWGARVALGVGVHPSCGGEGRGVITRKRKNWFRLARAGRARRGALWVGEGTDGKLREYASVPGEGGAVSLSSSAP